MSEVSGIIAAIPREKRGRAMGNQVAREVKREVERLSKRLERLRLRLAKSEADEPSDALKTMVVRKLGDHRVSTTRFSIKSNATSACGQSAAAAPIRLRRCGRSPSPCPIPAGPAIRKTLCGLIGKSRCHSRQLRWWSRLPRRHALFAANQSLTNRC